jgi:hypothetical protein
MANDRVSSLLYTLLGIVKRNIIRVDISQFLPLKTAAVNELKSEVSIISSKQKRTVLNARVVKKFLKEEETFFIEK